MQNQYKINWLWLLLNENAINLLEQNPEGEALGYFTSVKIDWQNIWTNENIFTYDYNRIKESKCIINDNYASLEAVASLKG